MDIATTNWVVIVLGVLAVVIELLLGVVTGFDLLVIGIILVLSGSIGLLTGSTTITYILIPLLCFIYLFGARRLLKQHLKIPLRRTNSEALIGKKGIVIKKISSETAGQVKVDGEIWRASSQHRIDEGSSVEIESVSGITLTVKET